MLQRHKTQVHVKTQDRPQWRVLPEDACNSTQSDVNSCVCGCVCEFTEEKAKDIQCRLFIKTCVSAAGGS